MATTKPAANTLERLVLLALGVVVVGVVLFLLIRGQPVDRSLATPLRFLLALAAAAIGGVAPGVLFSIAYRGQGLAIRAAGAAALFAAVWLGGPQLLPSLVQGAVAGAAAVRPH